MSVWMLNRRGADFKGLAAKLGVDPVLVMLMVNRGITSLEDMEHFLHPTLNFPDPHLLADVDLACELLMYAIDEGTHIRVIGDYDVDGIMSTYILVTAIEDCGGLVDYSLPHRVEDGYGINPAMVEKAAAEGVGLIITCDNGIAATPAIARARELGISLIVTDHHEIPFTMEGLEKIYHLPEADAVVDPKREDCPYPFKEICGAQVAMKVASCLYEMMGQEPSLADKFYVYAAMACICDVMELRGENRDLVYHGLMALPQVKNIGMQALIEACDLKDKKISAYTVGFVLGPCFNATGRLESAELSVELLREIDIEKAKFLASQLVELNEARKAQTELGIKEACDMVEKGDLKNDRVLVVYLPDVNESVAGIVAGRLKEKYYRPVLVITNSKEGAKGSGRSIEAYNMFEELSAVKDIFTKFGGHPMAAGISLPVERIDELRQRLNEGCSLSQDDLQEKILIDIQLPLQYLSVALIESFGLLEPFGTGNKKPVFALKDLVIKRAFRIGKEKQYLRLDILTEGGGNITGLVFNRAADFETALSDRYGKLAFDALLKGSSAGLKVDIIYDAQINEYNGNESVQIIINDFKLR